MKTSTVAGFTDFSKTRSTDVKWESHQLSCFHFRLLLWPSLITPYIACTQLSEFFKMKRMKHQKNTMIVINLNCTEAYAVEKAIFVVHNQAQVGWCLGTLLCWQSRQAVLSPLALYQYAHKYGKALLILLLQMSHLMLL